MRYVNIRVNGITRFVIALVAAQDKQIVLLQVVERLTKHLGMAPHVEQAIRFPVQVGEFGNDVPLELRMRAQGSNFILECLEFTPFGSLESEL